jgi:predicted GNAT superfamily acetyltransferase
MAEYRACVALQELTWGEGFSERVPVSIQKVNGRIGGVNGGAFDESGELVGFVFGMTGFVDGGPVHWSDMLAVRPEWRGTGLGVALKLYQRDVLLEAGVTRMRWTFDPLQSRNAHLNFARLGITGPEYVVDMYGVSNSPLHSGLGTDRFVALWEMDSDRVRRRVEGEGPPALPEVPRAFPVERGPEGVPVPGEGAVLGGLPHGELPPPPDPALPGLLVPVPADIHPLQIHHTELAFQWRHATRAVLASAIAAGWTATEFYRGDPASHYLLSPPRS